MFEIALYFQMNKTVNILIINPIGIDSKHCIYGKKPNIYRVMMA